MTNNTLTKTYAIISTDLEKMIASIILDLCFAFTAHTLPDVSRLTYHVDLESQRYLVLGFWDELVSSFETNKALTEKNRIKRKA